MTSDRAELERQAAQLRSLAVAVVARPQDLADILDPDSQGWAQPRPDPQLVQLAVQAGRALEFAAWVLRQPQSDVVNTAIGWSMLRKFAENLTDPNPAEAP